MSQYTAECPPTSLLNVTVLSPIDTEPDARVNLLEEYRRRRGEVFRATRAARDAAAAAVVVEEWASEAETQFARLLRRTGPVVCDGRHYSARKCDGVLRVEVRSAEGGDL